MLRDWEQGRTEPDQPARAYLTVTPAILRACSARCRVRQSHKVKNGVEPTLSQKRAFLRLSMTPFEISGPCIHCWGPLQASTLPKLRLQSFFRLCEPDYKRKGFLVYKGVIKGAASGFAGCSDTVTPFNGDHTAGIQVLSTRNFADDMGPLRQLTP
jgi:hypothetical protein